jgi:hypothetical protein
MRAIGGSGSSVDSGRIAPEPPHVVVYLQAVTMISTKIDGFASSA